MLIESIILTPGVLKKSNTGTIAASARPLRTWAISCDGGSENTRTRGSTSSRKAASGAAFRNDAIANV